MILYRRVSSVESFISIRSDPTMRDEVSNGLVIVQPGVNLGRKRNALAIQKIGRNVNREGQRWTEDRAGMTLRLPIDHREAVTEEARVACELTRVRLFARVDVERRVVTG